MHSHFNIHSHFIEALLINDIDKVKTFLKDPDFRVIFKAEEYLTKSQNTNGFWQESNFIKPKAQ